MSKRKIFLIAALILVTVLVATAPATRAYFSDTETSTGNLATGWQSAVHWATTQKDFQTGEQYFVDSSTSPGNVTLSQTNYLFACAGGGSNAVYRYSETTLVWESIASVPGTGVGAGGGLSYPGTGNYVYCLKGNSTTEFYRYDISANSWSAMTSVTAAVTTGGYLRSATDLYGNVCLYVLQGGSTAFYRYNISSDTGHGITADTWSTMAPISAATGAGASMTWDKISAGFIYATIAGGTGGSGGSNKMYQYNIANNTWANIANNLPANIGEGAEVSYTNTGTPCLYATQGNSGTGFYKFTPLSTSGSWSSMTATPAAVTLGGSLRWDDDGFLFAFKGGSNTFWRYNISLNTWAVTLAPVSYAVIAGGAYTSDNTRYNYAFTGGASNYFLKYDTAVVGGDTWSALTSPGSTGIGAALAYCTNVTPKSQTTGDYVFAFPGGTSHAFWVYSVSGGSWTTTLTSAGIGSDDGSSLQWTGADYIYAFFGKTKNFRRYTISTDTWTNLKSANTTVNNGAGLAWDHGNYIYATNGSGNTFERYSISADTWTNRANLPGNVNSGGSLNYPTNGTGGDALYAARGAGTVAFYKYSVSTNTWSVRDNVPSAVSSGGSLCSSSNGYIYCLPGNSTTNHWRYNVTNNVWAETLPNFPATTGAGARMGGHLTGYITSGYMTSEVIDNSGICEGGVLAYDGTNIYGTAGDLSASFRKYNISGNSWSLLTSLEDREGWGAALCSDKSTYIYAFAGNNKNTFRRYNTAANTWTAMAAAPGNVNNGGALVYVGTGTGYIYAYQGGTTAFWKYDVAGNSWSSLAATSAATGAGASLVYDGNYIYGTPGGGTIFRRYSISGNTWEDMTPRADTVGTGGGLAYPGTGNYIYCLEGNDTSDLYRYDTVANSWSQLSSTPTSVFQGGCLIGGDSGYLYTYRGRDTVSFWRYSISGDLWESMADTPAASYIRLDGLVWDRSLPSGTGITYQMRGSNTLFALADASPSWGATLTATDVNAGASSAVLSGLGSARYVQFKITFTTTYINTTPLLSERRVYFYRWY